MDHDHGYDYSAFDDESNSASISSLPTDELPSTDSDDAEFEEVPESSSTSGDPATTSESVITKAVALGGHPFPDAVTSVLESFYKNGWTVGVLSIAVIFKAPWRLSICQVTTTADEFNYKLISYCHWVLYSVPCIQDLIPVWKADCQQLISFP